MKDGCTALPESRPGCARRGNPSCYAHFCGSRARALARVKALPLASALVVLGLAVLVPRARALDPQKSVWQFNLRTSDNESGLPAGAISSVTQSAEGYLWLTVGGKLVRYDGDGFTTIPTNGLPLAARRVAQVMSQHGGGVWVESAGAVARYNPHGDAPAFSVLVSGAEGRTAMLETRAGDVWVGSKTALTYHLHGDAAGVVRAQLGAITALCEDAAGTVWIGTADHGLQAWRDGKLTRFADASLDGVKIQALAADARGALWVGTNTGLRCFDQGGRRRAIPAVDAAVLVLYVDRNNDVWIGTDGAGLGRLHGGSLQFLRKDDGFRSDTIQAICEDREGSLWVGTKHGLVQITDIRFPLFTEHEGFAAGSTHCVNTARDGALLVSDGLGFTYFDGKRVQRYGPEFIGTNSFTKLVFQARNGDFYVANGDKEISVISGGRVVHRVLAPEWPEGFAEDAESVIVNGGPVLFRIKDGKLEPYRYASGAPPRYDWIVNLSETADGGVLIAAANGAYRIKNGHVESWLIDDRAPIRTNVVVEDRDGTVWVGMPTGLARIRGNETKLITDENGLPDPHVLAIAFDRRGDLWLDSDRGIFRARRDSLNACADGRISRVDCELFDTADCVKTTSRTDQFNFAARTADGKIWLPSPRGVIMIDPEHYWRNTTPPQIDVEQRQEGSDRADRVAAARRQVEFSFAVLNFVGRAKLRVSYRLEEVDATWIDAGDRRSVRFHALPPGTYHLSIRATNQDGATATRTVGFAILPPFYRTYWFYAVCALAAGALLAGMHRWKVRRMVQAQAELAANNQRLEAKVAERTQELADGKARLEQTHRQLVEASRLAGMAEVATGVLHNVGNVLNSLNVSSNLIATTLRSSKIDGLGKLSALLREHHGDLAHFLTDDPKGRRVPELHGMLTDAVAAEHQWLHQEIRSMQENIDHIKEIVAMQQSYATVMGVTEALAPEALFEDALRMNAAALTRHDVRLEKRFEPVPRVIVEKGKVLQILTNVIRNAKYACDDGQKFGAREKIITVELARGPENRVRFVVRDNGIGIAPENLTRIFAHGFTTREYGHGFGLHSSALAAREMKGSLVAESEGTGKGATFILELPGEDPAGNAAGAHRAGAAVVVPSVS